MSKKELKKNVLREELLAITGDFKLALCLNQMCYWSTKRADYILFCKEENNIIEGVNNSKDYGWIFKSAKEFKAEALMNVGNSTMTNYLNKLVELGFLYRRNNPNHGWDKTYQYRVNTVAIAKAIEEAGYNSDEYNTVLDIYKNICFSIFKNCKSENENEKSNDENCNSTSKICKAITETTTEITNTEITTETTTEKVVAVDDNREIEELLEGANIKHTAKDISNLVNSGLAIEEIEKAVGYVVGANRTIKRDVLGYIKTTIKENYYGFYNKKINNKPTYKKELKFAKYTDRSAGDPYFFDRQAANMEGKEWDEVNHVAYYEDERYREELLKEAVESKFYEIPMQVTKNEDKEERYVDKLGKDFDITKCDAEVVKILLNNGTIKKVS